MIVLDCFLGGGNGAGERRLYYFQLKESWGLLRLYPEGVAAQLSYLKYMHTVNMHK